MMGNCYGSHPLWCLRNMTSASISGTIPTELGKLGNLQDWYLSLYLSSNSLSGTIPTELGLLERARELEMGENLLSGSLPTEIGYLAGLASLDVHDNLLIGTLPLEMQFLSELETVYVCSNQGLCGAGYRRTGAPFGVPLNSSHLVNGVCAAGNTSGTSLGIDCTTDMPTRAPTGSPTTDGPTVTPTTQAPTGTPTPDPLPQCFEALRANTYCCMLERLPPEVQKEVCRHHNEGLDVPTQEEIESAPTFQYVESGANPIQILD